MEENGFKNKGFHRKSFGIFRDAGTNSRRENKTWEKDEAARINDKQQNISIERYHEA